MDKNILEQRKFLEEQLEFIKKQDAILAEIENRLYEMKELAVNASNHQLTILDRNELNNRLNHLKREVDYLEIQLKLNVH